MEQRLCVGFLKFSRRSWCNCVLRVEKRLHFIHGRPGRSEWRALHSRTAEVGGRTLSPGCPAIFMASRTEQEVSLFSGHCDVIRGRMRGLESWFLRFTRALVSPVQQSFVTLPSLGDCVGQPCVRVNLFSPNGLQRVRVLGHHLHPECVPWVQRIHNRTARVP